MVYSYCPCCAKIDNQENEKCDFCNTNLIKTDIIYRFTDWAVNKSKIEVDLIYKFQIEDNPLFDKKIYLKRIKGDPLERRKELDRKKEQEEKEIERYYINQFNQTNKNTHTSTTTTTPNVPKCPTCGSTNVSKLSTTSKVVGTSLLGLASKTIGKTYKCKNCGYYW